MNFIFQILATTGKGNKAEQEAALAPYQGLKAKCLDTGHLGAETDIGALLRIVGGPLPSSQESLLLTE